MTTKSGCQFWASSTCLDVVGNALVYPFFKGILVSAIIYIMEDMPEAVQNVLWWHPLVHIIGEMRSGFFPMYQPQYISFAYVAGVSLFTLYIGLLLLGRYHRDILNR